MKISATPKIRVQSPAWSGLAPQRDGSKLLAAGVDGRMRAFQVETGESIWTSPLTEETMEFQTAGDTVVTLGRDSVSALHTEDGRLLWKSEGRKELVGVTDRVAATADRSGIEVLDLKSGHTLWSKESHHSPSLWKDLALTVGGTRDRAEVLRAHDPQSGEILWAVSDGKMDYIVGGNTTLLYANTKIGKHNQEYQLVSSRSATGASEWTHRASGPLRSEPTFSPDGTQIALKEKNPANPSRSFLTILNAESGELVFRADAGHKFEVNFLPDGGVVLAESEFALVPGDEETRLRRLDAQGQELWSKPGRPDWVWGGEHLVTATGRQMSKLDSHTGEVLWSKSMEAQPSPVSADSTQMTILLEGCTLRTLNLGDGEVVSTVTTGDKIFVGEGDDPIPLSDHQGRIWEQALPSGGKGRFQGSWPVAEPFHMSLHSGAITRDDKSAVFVDWDGDEQGTDHDPILLDSTNSVVSWEQLKKRDVESEGRLETESLKDLKLWFDMNGDGEVSSAEELSLLVSESFDKARMELSIDEGKASDQQGLLWLASDSICHVDSNKQQ